jgi:DNA polymerase
MDELPAREDIADEARALLAWYRAAGVEEVTGEEAVDWLARGDDAPGSGFRLSFAGAGAHVDSLPRADGAEPAGRGQVSASAAERRSLQRPPADGAASQPRPAMPVRQFPTASPDEAVMAARTAAKDAASLADLRARLEAFNGCGLKATAKNLCFYRGTERARLMLIGEAPGRDEDLSGVPFVGPAGQLLDKMLAAVGLSEADVHITNTVYWRPPGNRTPSPPETQACRPFLDRQIELVQPDMIALLGGAAANTVLGVPGGIMKLRGTWREIEVAGRKIKVLPTLHPAFLLRSPAHKRQAWRDVLALISALEAAG